MVKPLFIFIVLLSVFIPPSSYANVTGATPLTKITQQEFTTHNYHAAIENILCADVWEDTSDDTSNESDRKKTAITKSVFASSIIETSFINYYRSGCSRGEPADPRTLLSVLRVFRI